MAGKAEVKNNLEAGMFSKVSSLHIGDPYDQKAKVSSNFKGKQMGTSKGGGMFDEKPPRVFEGEAYHDPVKLRRKRERKAKQKQLTYKFTPTGAGVDTFSGKIPHLDPRDRPRKPAPKEPRNFLTNPAPKGTGYGYPDVTLASKLITTHISSRICIKGSPWMHLILLNRPPCL
eukprot:TRINITY_DN11946_c0_g1_i9.p1 TRINITY_DN11946_c0_g1~~TRINITY_DN11946_c0_g1_i9.p1  ORF type:complete len:173 (+),score=29.33 TRINITY_DN11946_c0_g1_i9:125-643(+)